MLNLVRTANAFAVLQISEQYRSADIGRQRFNGSGCVVCGVALSLAQVRCTSTNIQFAYRKAENCADASQPHFRLSALIKPLPVNNSPL